ncbi:MAG: succinate--CoA ligase subunit alpha [Sediminibacterium sp.]|nr:succinate--CoA ligase subunit alpha [Sediminibacterium sp.]
MSILLNKNSKVIVQGFTGSEGTSHGTQMIEYGTQLVGGVTPKKGGSQHLDRPVFNTVYDAKKATAANVSIIFVPPLYAADAILEAIDAQIELIVCITEGIPVKDMISVKQVLKRSNSRLIGPNCPGLITPDESKVGIMPGFIFKSGNIGLVSKSGTLTYEAAEQIRQQGLGISTAVGIGGDPIIGTTTKEIVELFMADDKTEAIVMIGEIGGGMEAEASRWISENGNKKPVVGFIVGQTAPPGRRMGHAGAIVGGAEDTAAAKMAIMNSCGLIVVESPAAIGSTIKKALS